MTLFIVGLPVNCDWQRVTEVTKGTVLGPRVVVSGLPARQQKIIPGRRNVAFVASTVR